MIEIIRKPKSIFKRGEYKANEYRGLLLYYLRFALSGLLNIKYIKHFHLLSSAVYMLLKENVRREDLDDAQRRLNEYTDLFETLYGQSNVTMNLHLIKHLPMAVSNLGPLWAQSAFGFEANNGVIVKSNTSKKDILHQLAWKYSMRQTIKSIDKCEKFADVLIGGKRTMKISPAEMQLLLDAGLCIKNQYPTIYRNFVKGGIRFTCLKSNEVQTIDYFVETEDKLIGAVNFYIISDGDLYAFLNLYENVYTQDQFLEIEATNTQKVIHVSNISKKLLYLKFGIKKYVTTIPNKYEKT